MYMFSVTYFLTLLSRGMSICGTQPDIMVFFYSNPVTNSGNIWVLRNPGWKPFYWKLLSIKCSFNRDLMFITLLPWAVWRFQPGSWVLDQDPSRHGHLLRPQPGLEWSGRSNGKTKSYFLTGQSINYLNYITTLGILKKPEYLNL